MVVALLLTLSAVAGQESVAGWVATPLEVAALACCPPFLDVLGWVRNVVVGVAGYFAECCMR